MIDLHVEDWGDGAPLVMLHGFTGSIETWRPFRTALAYRRMIAVDLLGHGASPAPHDPAEYAMAREVDRIVRILDRARLERVDLVGYSLGGRVALQVALAHPDRLGALVLESASPGIEDARERDARVAADEALATILENDGVEAFIDRWERVPLFASQQSLAPEVRERQRADRLRRSAVGLAGSLRGAGAGVAPPVLEFLDTLGVATTLIVGSLDTKYMALARAMADRLPRARKVEIADAGHAVHLERPAPFAHALLEALDAVPVA